MKFYQKILGLRDGDGVRTSLMFAYIFLIIASLMIVKPIRNSLFLTEFGAEKLPFAYLLVAIVSALVVWLYSKFSKNIRLNYLIFYTTKISIVGFFVVWLLLHFNYMGAGFLYGFYVWVTIFSVISAAQFWLLANYVFNAREARRTFGVIGAGAISGGIFGGYLTNYLATIIKTNNLLFVCMGFLLICMLLLWLVWNKSARYRYLDRSAYRKRPAEAERSGNVIKIITGSRHLTYLAGIIGLGVVAANLVDYQFSAIASSVIADRDRLTAFFGFWMSNLSIASLFIQLLFTGRILKHLGAAPSLLFLPIGILIGAATIIFNPALWSAILTKVSEGSFKHSINKAGLELSILPIPNDIKNKVKAFIDVFIDALATGIGGILLILFTIMLGLSIEFISLILVGIIAIWIFLVIRMREEYIDSFRHAIEKREIDLAQQTVNLRDASVVKSFIKVLDGTNERQILYVLGLFEGSESNELIPYIKKLVNFKSDEVRIKALRLAVVYEELDLTNEAIELIQSGNQDIKIEAIRYLYLRSDDKLATLKHYLNHDDLYILAATLLFAAREARDNAEFRDVVDFKAIYVRMRKSFKQADVKEESTRYFKTIAARVIGIAGDPKLHPYLHFLLNDNSPEVLRYAIVSAGQSGADEFIPILVKFLARKHTRTSSRLALAGYGEEIIPHLTEHLENPAEDYGIRLAIPRVLALIGSPKSVRSLLDNLDQKDMLLRYEIIKSLNKLKAKFPSVRIDKSIIGSRILDETEHYYKTLAVLDFHQNYKLSKKNLALDSINQDRIMKARRLMIKALEEKLDNNLERIFRLLGLRYLPQDMYNAYLGVRSNKSDLQANAIEFLDNLIEPNLKKYIIPIIDTTSPRLLLEKSRDYVRFDLPSEDFCFDYLLQGDDNWLKTCALYLLAELGKDECADIIAKLVNDSDPIVKETAEYCNARISASN
ncbi:MAG: hypothetical protein GY839_18500 [candidate division Zixibacteria bacterium]|nr:hypothetical protein [candidate division Zixibacteria bacterium]